MLTVPVEYTLVHQTLVYQLQRLLDTIPNPIFHMVKVMAAVSLSRDHLTMCRLNPYHQELQAFMEPLEG
jgi:hypothetical protein